LNDTQRFRALRLSSAICAVAATAGRGPAIQWFDGISFDITPSGLKLAGFSTRPSLDRWSVTGGRDGLNVGTIVCLGSRLTASSPEQVK